MDAPNDIAPPDQERSSTSARRRGSTPGNGGGRARRAAFDQEQRESPDHDRTRRGMYADGDGPRRELTLRAWWRVPVLALVTGLLAYIGSFVVPASYSATTRVLIRGRDATILSSTGTDLGSQPGIVDSTLGASLANTQIAVLGSREVAEAVVTRLRLDKRPEETGAIHAVKAVVAGTIKRTRAYLSHGLYREPGKREQAVQDVAGGLSGAPVGESFVVEITGSGGTPEDARDIANTAADVLVEMSNSRSSGEAEAHRAALETQLNASYAAQVQAEEAIAKYKRENNITSLDTSLVLSASSAQELRTELNATEAEISAAKAKLAETKAQLDKTAPTSKSTTAIQTGRSATELSTSSENATHTALLNSTQELSAEIAGLNAKSAALTKMLASSPAGAAALPATEAGLSALQLRREVAADVVRTLSTDYEQAVSRTQSGSEELTRLDRAGLPVYPAAPVRWMYLLVGLVVGGLLAFTVSYRRLRRAGAFAPQAVLEHDWELVPVMAKRVAVAAPISAGSAATAWPGNGHEPTVRLDEPSS